MLALLLPLLLDHAAARRRRRGYIPDPTPEETSTFPATATPRMTPPPTPVATWRLPIRMDGYIIGVVICLSGICVSLVLVTYSVMKQCTVIRKANIRSEGVPLMGGAPRGLL
jgi:hypothetical protein